MKSLSDGGFSADSHTNGLLSSAMPVPGTTRDGRIASVALPARIRVRGHRHQKEVPIGEQHMEND